MEVIVRFKYLQVLLQKVWFVVDLVCGKGVQDVVNILVNMKKYVVWLMEKLFKLVIVNVENFDDMVDIDEFFVKEIFVDGGLLLKCLCFVLQGCVYCIFKWQSYIIIKLDWCEEFDDLLESEEQGFLFV